MAVLLVVVFDSVKICVSRAGLLTGDEIGAAINLHQPL